MSHTNICKTDVLIIGSGAAGLRCAIELADKKVDVLVIGKCKKREAHTVMAAGGINAALKTMDKEDSAQLHAADTIRDGGGINDPTAVQLLAKHAPAAIKELAKWGAKFHKEKNGKITQRFFGAATYRRACFVGDKTGKAILNTLVDQAEKRKIPFKSEIYIYKLLTNKKTVNGAVGINLKTGKQVTLHAKVVVLATGGHSRVYRRSSSRFWENTGDGIGLAYEVGVKFMDMEMFQFHPTGMVWPKEAEGILVTEAVRGEGGILTNKKGERFMEAIDPERKELSARDIVARANYFQITKGKGTRRGGVYLDISHKSKNYLQKRLPNMVSQFKKFANVDISKQKMEVAPTAHYSMGGVMIDHKTGQTDVKNLYAIGEVTSGVHGGNRLGGNSLAECMVFGKLTGQSIAKALPKTKLQPLSSKTDELELSKRGKNPIKIKEKIQTVMSKHAGVVKNEKELNKALEKIKKLKATKLKTGESLEMNEKLIAALDVKAMLVCCEMILMSALKRKESRAAHYRSDYPNKSKAWNKNIVCQPTASGFKLSNRGLEKLPVSIKQHLKKKVESKLLE